MAIKLNQREIKSRAIHFAKEWEDVENERAEAQSFWNDFFEVFGVSRRRLGTYEEPVKRLGDKRGFIDLFWKKQLIVEHKSKGEDLDKAYTQAVEYLNGIADEDLPKYILVSDFDRIRLHDLEDDTDVEFNLKDLHKKIELFGFISGYEKREYRDEDPVNIRAAELMGKLHDSLYDNGYIGHELEIFLVRTLFCLFADDTGIFQPKDQFTFFIEELTREDGSDLGARLNHLFQILDTLETKRQKNLDETLNSFPYVNGDLFKENLRAPAFDSKMRKILLDCCYFDWSQISPAIFGSMFQSVMDKGKRKNLGAHYTSEQNIMKAVKGLFLDELYEEFEKIKGLRRDKKKQLTGFHRKLANLKFFDPACGCGNFLIIAYREIRLLEMLVLKEIFKLEGKHATAVFDLEHLTLIDVDAFYGIEIEEFPTRIAETAMWLVDHQMNIKMGEEFGDYFVRLPLKKSPHIIHGNALDMDWNEIVSKDELSYILGNPPFIAKKNRDTAQNEDMKRVCSDINNYGLLDYVCCWYVKAVEYINGTGIKVAFVSTNSITQGEQTGVLWPYLFRKGLKIHFAHRTFKWYNQAKGKAQVYVVIIGFALSDTDKKLLYDYETPSSEAMEMRVKNINPFLVDFDDLVIVNRSKPICDVPDIVFGSMPNDGGNFLFTDDEKKEFLKMELNAKQYIKPLISAKEYLSGEKRWCLWLDGAKPSEWRKLKEVVKRVDNVKKLRSESKREATNKLAAYPHLFGEIRQPVSNYIFIPLTTSEHRRFIPMAFLTKDKIVNNTCSVIPNATLFHFGVLMSSMHMAWVRQICGRMKSDYRYSNNLVYNNYP